MIYVLIVIVILLFVILLTRPEEPYRSCRDCDGYAMAPNGTPVLNPFIWPYSGTGCVDDVYILGKDAGVDIGTAITPLTHASAPDHVILTN
jgi:hypothetical protein